MLASLELACCLFPVKACSEAWADAEALCELVSSIESSTGMSH